MQKVTQSILTMHDSFLAVFHAESDEGRQLHSVYGASQELLLLILMLKLMM